jgi:Tropinone reductase 1
MGDPSEIANLACFLAMPASSYISGQSIKIDGGFTTFGFGGMTNT